MLRLLPALVVLLSVIGCGLIDSYYIVVLPLDDARAINNSGAIAGRVGDNAAVYTQGSVVLLPGKAGYSNLIATDIADNGFIVGTGLSAGNRRGLFWSSMAAEPLDMGALGKFVVPIAVNSQGVAVGWYWDESPPEQKAFRWSRADGMRPIAPDMTSQSHAYDISETSYIAGEAWYGFGQQAVRWYPNGQVNRITGPGYARRAQRDGSVFGPGPNGRTNLWPLLWNGTPINIGPNPASHPVFQISAVGRMVGAAYVVPTRAWTTRYPTQTAVYLPVPAGAAADAYDVDACGTILGTLLQSNVYKPVIWGKLICDGLSQPVPTQ